MKNKITPLMIFGILWLAVVIISWNVFPAWKKMEGGIWILIVTAAIGVLAFLKDSVEYIKAWLETPSSPDNKSTASQPMPYQSAATTEKSGKPILSQPSPSQSTPDQTTVGQKTAPQRKAIKRSVIKKPVQGQFLPNQTDETDSKITDIPWEKCDQELVTRYFAMLPYGLQNYNTKKKQKEYLLSYGLLKNVDNQLLLTQAGVLLFCKKEAFPQSLLHTEIILRYETQNQDTERKRIFSGSILKSYEEIFEILKPLTTAWKGTNLRNEYRQEREYFYYPNIVIEEALINFIVHRDYLIDDKGFITIYDDRIEFCNPGTSAYTAEELMMVTRPLRPSYQRNPRLLQVLARTNLNSNEGWGIKRINDLRTRRVSHSEYGLPGITEIKKALIENQSVNPQGDIGIFIENDNVHERFRLVIYKKIPSAPMSAIASVKKPRLLIIEDDIDIGNMLGIYFDSYDIESFVAIRGSLGLLGCQAIQPHGIILDIMLPDLDGYEICRILRTNLRTRHIPIIFLTQKDERSDKLQGLELGADDYITKPFDIEELKLRLLGLLRRSERESLTEPRTGLPGARLTEEELHRILPGNDWAVLDIQINHFDTFYETHGFVAASYVLRFTSLLIGEVLDDFAARNHPSKNGYSFFPAIKDFVGHVGLDNFFIITSDQNAADIRLRLKERFVDEVQTEYKLEDRERGYMLLRKSKDKYEKVPLMSLSVGLISSKSDRFADVNEVMKSAAQARVFDKRLP